MIGERGSATAVVVLALGLRLLLLARVESEDARELMAPDSYTYEHLGQSLLTQGSLNAASLETPTSRAPGYPVFLALTYGAFGPSRRMAIVGQAVLSALTVLLVYLAGRRLLSHAAGITAALLLALDPPSILAANLLLTETQFTLIVFAAFFVALRIDPAKATTARESGAFAVMLGLAALTRPIGLPLLAPGVLWLGWREWRRDGPALKPAVVSASIAVAVWFGVVERGWLLASPRTRTVSMSLGPKKFLLLSRGADIVAQRDSVPPAVAREGLLLEANAEASQTGKPIEELYAKKASDLIRAHPGFFLWSQVRWLPELLLGTGAAGLIKELGWNESAVSASALKAICVSQLLVVYLGVFACAWFAVARARPPVSSTALVLAFLFVASFVILSAGPQTYSRFRVPMMPLLTLGAGLGLARLGSSTARR